MDRHSLRQARERPLVHWCGSHRQAYSFAGLLQRHDESEGAVGVRCWNGQGWESCLAHAPGQPGLLSWRTSVSSAAHSGAANWPRWRNAFVVTPLIACTSFCWRVKGPLAFGVPCARGIFMAEIDIVTTALFSVGVNGRGTTKHAAAVRCCLRIRK